MRSNRLTARVYLVEEGWLVVGRNTRIVARSRKQLRRILRGFGHVQMMA